MRRTASVTSTISLRCLRFDRLGDQGVGLHDDRPPRESRTGRPAAVASDPRGPARGYTARCDDTRRRRAVHRVVEREPQLRQAAREFPGDAFRACGFDLPKLHDHPMRRRFRKLHRDACRSPQIYPQVFPDTPRQIFRAFRGHRCCDARCCDLVLRVGFWFHQRKLRRQLPFRRNAGTNQSTACPHCRSGR